MEKNSVFLAVSFGDRLLHEKQKKPFILLNNEMECIKSTCTCLVLLDIHIEQVSYFVLLEKDYPPVARAGNDVVIVLPVDHVTLYGNGSTDDKVDGLK